jgi:tetratricopeptide (TPR) repeat protein
LAAVFAVFVAGPAVAQPAGQTIAVAAQAGPTQAEARRRQLLAAMMADPANLDIAFEYATLSVEVGDLEGAVATLERMLIFAPGLPRLQLELGVLYYRLGANDVARSYLDAVMAQPGVPEDVRAKVQLYLDAIDGRGETSGLHGQIMVGARYQTNANSAPSSNIVNLNGLPFTLNTVNAPDANGFVAGNFRFSQDLASQGDRFIATLSTYGALYANQTQLNTGVAELTAGPQFNLQRIRVENTALRVYGIGTGVLLGGSPYLLGVGAGAELETQFGPQLSGSFALEYRHEMFQNSATRPTASLRTGHRVTGSSALQYKVSDDVTLFGVLMGERRIAQVGFQSLWEFGVTGGVVFDFASPIQHFEQDWSLILSASYFHRQFDAPDPLINAALAQVDDDIQLSAALTVPLDDDWSLQGAVSYRAVESNYGLSDMTNFSVTAGVLKEF